MLHLSSSQKVYIYTILHNIFVERPRQEIGGSTLTTLCISAPVLLLLPCVPFFPLNLIAESGDNILLRDLLSIHMVRSIHGSTIISYHASPESESTSAKNLQSRIRLAGKSVYWTNIFNNSRDPTFVLLTILWHAMYSWDEALSCLYEHITDQVST